MANKTFSRIGVAIALIALAGGIVVFPVWLAVDGTISLLTTEPTRVEEVSCVSGVGSRSGHCSGTWTLADGEQHHGRLSGEWFVSDGESFDGYGNDVTASPTRVLWMLSQLLYLIPVGLVVAFIRFHRKSQARAAGRSTGLSTRVGVIHRPDIRYWR